MNFRKSRHRSTRRYSISYSGTEKWRGTISRPSRKGPSFLNDSSDDEEEETELDQPDIENSWEQELFHASEDLTDTISDQDMEVKLTRKQTIILSTLLPDEILFTQNFTSTETRRFVGVLLMADVSGYTALSERYSSLGKAGTYRLTVTLNTYLGALIELIYDHGGDVLKFAGDAFLALWKTDKKTFLSHTIHQVLMCALVIQKSYASYETDAKVNLKVKLAISAGNLLFAPIGTGIDMNYIVYGLPVLEAKQAESVCTSGEVMLAATAWAHCYSRNYDYVVHSDGNVTIRAILYDPRDNDVSKPFLAVGSLRRPIKKHFTAVENLPESYWDASHKLNAVDQFKKCESLSLRKSILHAEKSNIGGSIRNFMIRPVLTQIDAHQPLEYLTEMRIVSVVFITLKPKQCPFPQLVTVVNNSYQITCDIVYKSMGCVNKIILFDKDVMILVVFGLRGFKHESEAQVAIKCAYSIKKSVSALDGVIEVSIGVTTGQVYCGVVGHPLRREFTIIGSVVNKAARLMCYFRNKITCDETTYVKSKMSTNAFTLQPQPELRGISQPGKIFEYTEEIRVKELYNIGVIPPLLDRFEEMKVFTDWLVKSNMDNSVRQFDAILFIGESRIGKTRLLEWMARYARNDVYNVCYIALTSIHSATPYLGLSQIINKILNIKEPFTNFLKEEKIVNLLQAYDEDLCFLNNILKVRFAYYEGMHGLTDEQRQTKTKRIFNKFINCLNNPQVILLDDLHNLDMNSWEYISIMLKSPRIFTIFTLTHRMFTEVHRWMFAVFMSENIKKIRLGPLDSKWIPPLACQLLDVNAVPNDLCSALKTKCKGMPGLVESFIVHLFSCGALELQKMTKPELEQIMGTDMIQFPDHALLHPQALLATYQKALDQYLEEDYTEEYKVCTIIDKEELNTNINMQNNDAIIMIQIDSLTPYQQLLLKIASVIGDVFSRDLLENIMYENDSVTTARAIKRLFSMRIITCANITQVVPNKNGNLDETLNCNCPFEYDPVENNNLPKYAYCKIIKFKSKNLRRTCYELLPINQKKEFHARIVNYLENSKHKCLPCGGSIVVAQYMIYYSSEADGDRYSVFNENEDYYNESASYTSINDDNFRYSQSETGGKDVMQTRSETRGLNPNTKPDINCSILKSISEDFSLREVKRRSTKRVTLVDTEINPNTDEINIQDSFRNDDSRDIIHIYDQVRVLTEASRLQEWEALGLKDSILNTDNNDKLELINVKLEKNVSLTNFSMCTCTELNILIHEQLIFHAKNADLKKKALKFLIKYCQLNIIHNTSDSAFPILNEAEAIFYEIKSDLTKYGKRRFLGKIYALKAAAFLMDNNLSSAKYYTDHAAKLYGYNLHKVTDFIRVISAIRNSRYHSSADAITSDAVFYLNVASSVYLNLNEETIARTASQRAIHLIIQKDCGNIELFDALTNALLVEMERGCPEATAELDRVILNVLKNLPNAVAANELYSLGKLLLGVFRARIARAQLTLAMYAGYKAICLSRFLIADVISMEILPDLFYILLARRHILEAVTLAKDCFSFGKKRNDVAFETWYYALCIDLVLDAGFQLESPQEISRFAEYTISDGGNHSGQQRLITGLWTYWLRAQSERLAKRFETKALEYAVKSDDECRDSLTTLISSLRLAEAMIESLAHKVEDLKKVVDLMELRSLADRELSVLEPDARRCKAVYPRWLLIRANCYHLSGRKSQAAACFAQALEEARKSHNRMEEATAVAASNHGPCLWLQNARSGRFMGWQAGAEKAKTSWHELMYKLTTSRQ
ncbi:hypothetical protein JYU34_005218 [Plutella xylostella]|uniref:Guanylate cyclase domain-containing protein n=1 Tax=Plutella xylostella TaxID=51655 RepID=A0ABQ7QW58_PLUXY|nr:hypothetical protein JYU34_005218 [Plutella xylostella]